MWFNDPLFDPVIFITQVLATLVAGVHIALILFIILLLIHFITKASWTRAILSFCQRNSLLLAFIVVLTAVTGSLFYSEIAHYEPCKLCWYQRIAIFPLPLLYLIGLIRKEKQILFYTLPQVLIGLGIAIYHYFHQILAVMNPTMDISLPCSTVGMTPSCTGYFFLEYGYITIPMMSLTTLTAVLVCSLLMWSSYKKTT